MPKNKQPPLKDYKFYNYFGFEDTPLQRLYLELEARIWEEVRDLKERYFSKTTKASCCWKVMEIKDCLYLLRRALFIKENFDDYVHLIDRNEKDDLDLFELTSIEFNTMNDLLDYRASFCNESGVYKSHQSTLREALNMSRSLSVTFSFAFFGTMWGKAKALENFEKSLEENKLFNVDLYKDLKMKHIDENEDLINTVFIWHPKPVIVPEWVGRRLEKNGPA